MNYKVIIYIIFLFFYNSSHAATGRYAALVDIVAPISLGSNVKDINFGSILKPLPGQPNVDVFLSSVDGSISGSANLLGSNPTLAEYQIIGANNLALDVSVNFANTITGINISDINLSFSNNENGGFVSLARADNNVSSLLPPSITRIIRIGARLTLSSFAESGQQGINYTITCLLYTSDAADES